MSRLSEQQIWCLTAAEWCRYRGLDGCAFRGAEQRTARSLVWRRLLYHAGRGLVGDEDFDGGREYELWGITPIGREMLKQLGESSEAPDPNPTVRGAGSAAT